MQTLFSCSNHRWDYRFSTWRIPGGSLDAPWGSLRVPKGSLEVRGESLEGPWRLPGSPRGSLGVPGGTWRVPGGPLDHQMLCFPMNLKSSVPGVPDANPVQLFKSSLGQTFQHHWFGTPSFRCMGKALCKRSRKRGTPRNTLPGSR